MSQSRSLLMPASRNTCARYMRAASRASGCTASSARTAWRQGEDRFCSSVIMGRLRQGGACSAAAASQPPCKAAMSQVSKLKPAPAAASACAMGRPCSTACTNGRSAGVQRPAPAHASPGATPGRLAPAARPGPGARGQNARCRRGRPGGAPARWRPPGAPTPPAPCPAAGAATAWPGRRWPAAPGPAVRPGRRRRFAPCARPSPAAPRRPGRALRPVVRRGDEGRQLGAPQRATSPAPARSVPEGARQAGKGLVAQQLHHGGIGGGQRTFGQRAGVGLVGLQAAPKASPSRIQPATTPGRASRHSARSSICWRSASLVAAFVHQIGCDVHAGHCGRPGGSCRAGRHALQRRSAACRFASSTASFGQVGVPLHQRGPRAQAAHGVCSKTCHTGACTRLPWSSMTMAAAVVVAGEVDLAHAGRLSMASTQSQRPGSGHRAASSPRVR
jgi:hypothetical protein